MEILRFALGARFPLPGDTLEAAFEKECLEALLQALCPQDMAGLQLYGGLDEHTDPQAPAYIAVIMNASLKAGRRVYDQLKPALASRLCRTRPFIESNRIAHLTGLTYYGQGDGMGGFAGGAPLP